MKFSRVNDHTIHCIISKEELEGNGLTLEDIIGRKVDAMQYLHRVVLEAARQEHLKMNTGFTSMQVQARTDGSVILTISNDNPEEPAAEDPMQALREAIETVLSSKERGKSETKESSKPRQYCYRFYALADAAACCRRLPQLARMNTSLWHAKNGDYHMLVASEKEDLLLQKAILAMNEFGTFAETTPEAVAYMMEHETCILKENAAAQLIRM